MGAMIQPVRGSFALTDHIFGFVTADLTDEIATRRPRGGEGASIAWILGHLCRYRVRAMNVLGADRADELAEIFGDSADDGAGYPDVAELRSIWGRLAEDLQAVLATTSDEQLIAALPSGQGHGEKNVLDTLNFLMWHEAYHMGVLGAIRAEFGLKATATLVMEATEGQALRTEPTGRSSR